MPQCCKRKLTATSAGERGAGTIGRELTRQTPLQVSKHNRQKGTADEKNIENMENNKTFPPLKPIGVILGVPSLQSVALDQIIPAMEDGCWVPGRDIVPSVLRWVCEICQFETAYDLLQSFPSFCTHHRYANDQRRTCERLLIEFFPDSMDDIHKRRLHASWRSENKDYTQEE